MDKLNQAISILMKLVFRPADRAEIEKTIREVIRLLENARDELS